MKNVLSTAILIISINCSLYSQSTGSFYNIRNNISSDLILTHLKVLADDSLLGRGLGSPGEYIAADYISEYFKKLGLSSLISSGTFFQNIPMHGSIPLSSSELILYTADDTISVSYSSEYFLYRSGQQTFIPVPIGIVFAGYGIVAPEYDYNDYQEVNVEGKIVVFVDGEPESDDKDYFNGPAPTIYSYAESKRRIAVSRGAYGTVQIPLSQYDNWESVRKDFDTEDITLAYSVSGNLSIIINPGTADKLFINSGHNLADIKLMHQHNRMRSFPLKTKLKFKGSFKEREFIGRNVISVIRGSDPELSDSYLIISAHYDHLGIGIPVKGDSIYNGALDNAIGVSVLLELSRAFSQLKIKPKRSIIFIALTGEEKGLLGSGYYIDNPVVPLYKTIANVNIDGIALSRHFNGIVPIGAGYSTLDIFLEQTADRYNLIIEDIPPQFKKYDAFNKSDQLAFASGGIPSILILEGISNALKTKDEMLEEFIDYYLNRYHTPFDDLNQEIDPEAAVKHAKVLFDFCFHLADQLEVPEWKSGAPFLNARLRSIAEKR